MGPNSSNFYKSRPGHISSVWSYSVAGENENKKKKRRKEKAARKGKEINQINLSTQSHRCAPRKVKVKVKVKGKPSTFLNHHNGYP